VVALPIVVALTLLAQFCVEMDSLKKKKTVAPEIQKVNILSDCLCTFLMCFSAV